MIMTFAPDADPGTSRRSHSRSHSRSRRGDAVGLAGAAGIVVLLLGLFGLLDPSMMDGSGSVTPAPGLERPAPEEPVREGPAPDGPPQGGSGQEGPGQGGPGQEDNSGS